MKPGNGEVGAVGTGKKSRRKAIISIAAVILVLVVALVAWLFVVQRVGQGRLVEKLPDNTDTNIGTTPESMIPKVMEHKYNVPFDSLKTYPLLPQIKSFEMALDTSTAFTRLKNYNRAYEAYKVADQKKPKDGDTVEFRHNYCRVAYDANDKAAVKKQCELAKEKLGTVEESDEEGVERVAALQLLMELSETKQ